VRFFCKPERDSYAAVMAKLTRASSPVTPLSRMALESVMPPLSESVISRAMTRPLPEVEKPLENGSNSLFAWSSAMPPPESHISSSAASPSAWTRIPSFWPGGVC
jgi:hypothetical protein